MERRRKMCTSHWSVKYRSRSWVKVPAISVHQGEALCKVVVVGLIVEELSNINVKCVKYRSRSPGQGTCKASVKCVKVTGVQNISQGDQVKVLAESVHREEVLYKVWWLKALQLRTYGRAT